MVRADLRGDSDGGLYVPVRVGEHVGAQAYGGDPSGSDRAGFVHHRCFGASILRRCPHRPGVLRAGTGEDRYQQAKRHSMSFAAPIHPSVWKGNFSKFAKKVVITSSFE